jgi:hypothetical protein
VAIWSGVTGKASDMVGVWIAPVMAQLMMTLSDLVAMTFSPFQLGGLQIRFWAYPR